MTHGASRRSAVATLLATVAAIITDVAYVVLIRSQDATPPHAAVIPFVVVYIAAIAALGLLSVWLLLEGCGAAAKPMLVAAAAGSASLGFIAIFSIGVGILVAAGFFAAAAAGAATNAGRTPQVLGALGAVGLLIAGFTVTGVFWGIVDTIQPAPRGIPHIGGMTDTVLIVTSGLTALAATAAALFAGLAIRAQDRAQRRQQALENFRWLNNSWDALRSYRGRAARSLREDHVAVTDIREILNFLENTGYLVRHRYLDLEIAEAVFAPQIRGWWNVGQSVVASGRAEFGPTIYEDLEWLHSQLRLPAPHLKGWNERFLSREEANLGEDSGGAPAV